PRSRRSAVATNASQVATIATSVAASELPPSDATLMSFKRCTRSPSPWFSFPPDDQQLQQTLSRAVNPRPHGVDRHLLQLGDLLARVTFDFEQNERDPQRLAQMIQQPLEQRLLLARLQNHERRRPGRLQAVRHRHAAPQD